MKFFWIDSFSSHRIYLYFYLYLKIYIVSEGICLLFLRRLKSQKVRMEIVILEFWNWNFVRIFKVCISKSASNPAQVCEKSFNYQIGVIKGNFLSLVKWGYRFVSVIVKLRYHIDQPKFYNCAWTESFLLQYWYR